MDFLDAHGELAPQSGWNLKTFKILFMSSLHASLKRILSIATDNQRTNGPVNAHLISGPRISTQHTNPK